MVLMQVVPPSVVQIDTYSIAMLFLSFIILAGVIWGIKHLVRLISRS